MLPASLVYLNLNSSKTIIDLNNPDLFARSPSLKTVIIKATINFGAFTAFINAYKMQKINLHDSAGSKNFGDIKFGIQQMQ